MATLGSPVVQHSIEGESKKHYLHKWVLYLSAPQVLFGVVCVIFQGVLVDKETLIHFVGQGFWAGVLFIVTGILGIISSQKKTTGPIIAFLSLSVLAVVGSLGLLVPSAIAWRVYDEERRYTYYGYGQRFSGPNPGKIAIPLNAMMVCIAVIQAILAILSSAFACHGLCCEEKIQNPHQAVIGHIQYLTAANGQPQMVVIPMGQQGAALQPTGAMTGASTMPTAGFNVQPTQPPVYEPPTTTPPEYKMQETLGEQHM